MLPHNRVFYCLIITQHYNYITNSTVCKEKCAHIQQILLNIQKTIVNFLQFVNCNCDLFVL